MPGTFIFRPLKANIEYNPDLMGKMNPYCKIKLGGQKVKSRVCKNGDKQPSWDDTLTVQHNNEPFGEIVLKDKNKIWTDSIIGTCKIDLQGLVKHGGAIGWFDIAKNNKVKGKVLMEILYDNKPAEKTRNGSAPATLRTSGILERLNE